MSYRPLKRMRIYRLDTATLKQAILSDISEGGKLPFSEIEAGLGCLSEPKYTTCATTKKQALTQIFVTANVPGGCFTLLFNEARRHTKDCVTKVKGNIFGKRITIINRLAEHGSREGYRVGYGDSAYITYDKEVIRRDLEENFGKGKYDNLVMMYLRVEAKLKRRAEAEKQVELAGEAGPIDQKAVPETKCKQMELFAV